MPNIDDTDVFFLILIFLNFSVVNISYLVASCSRPISKNSTSCSISRKISLSFSSIKPYLPMSFKTLVSKFISRSISFDLLK